MTTDFTKYVSELGLDEHRQYLLGIARPSVEIITANTPIIKHGSKFGGCPDLPDDFEWPHHKLGLYRFIAQFNLADIPHGPHKLPAVGLLSFFYADDKNGNSFWRDPNYVRAYLFTNVGVLKPVEPPPAVRFGSASTIRFQLGADVPPWPFNKSGMKDWPISESQRDDYWELRCSLHPSRGYLMGYPFNTTLAYDPTPGTEWQSLLTLSSDEKLEWCWHDGGRLVAFIEKHRLAVSDFSQIKADAG